MALHIADPEVGKLVTKLAKLEKITKTELLRRVLRKAMQDREHLEKRKGLKDLMDRIIAEGRKRRLKPVTKKEMDKLWGMDQLDGY
jgi:hypothetical protein